MFKEEEKGTIRINEQRAKDAVATGAKVISVNCPYCTTMLEDGVKAMDKQEEIEVLDIAEMIITWGLPAWGFLLVVNLLLLIAGNFMEPSAILLIMAPILFPIAMKLGIDPIHLGIIMVVNMEIGMITPPVALNLFVIAGITQKPMGWAISASLPWLLLLLFFLMLITFIPQISLFLPELFDSINGYK